MTKTPEQMAEDWLLGRWYAVHDPTISGESKVAFLAGYKAGQQHPFQFQTKMWVDPIGPQDRWISVKERLPEIPDTRSISEDVLWLTRYGEMEVSCLERLRSEFRVDWGEAGSLKLDQFTHWMPLPEPPKE